MTDDDRQTDADGRDERTAALLEVAPLDDVTRRRLVQRALGEAGPAAPGWSSRLLRVAAAVVGVAVVGGGAALVLRDGDDTSREAAPTTASEADAAGGADRPETLEAAPAPVDLGDVAGPADLRRRLEAIAPSPATSPRDQESASSDTDARAFTGLAPECGPTLDAVGAAPGPLVASLTYQGVPSLVVVDADGSQAYVLDRTDPVRCPLLATVPLV